MASSLINFSSLLLDDRTLIKSRTPRSYSASPGAPLLAYKAAKNLKEKLNSTDYHGAEAPTLVLMSEEDELVDSLAIAGLPLKYEWLQDWKTEFVSIDHSELPESFHHLIADSKSVGRMEWERMKDLMRAHLNSNH